ncbi:MAG: ELWxxDGT repeat protein, partial [Luteibaculum sp.]
RDDENGNELRVLHVDSIRPSLTKNLRYKSSSADIDFLKVLGDKLLFEYRGSWYTSDGTEEGTFSLNIPAENDRFGFFLYDQDGLYFLMEPERNEPGNATVWKLDASTLSTQYIGKFTEENESSYPHDLLAINDKLLFFADAGGGSTLYSYDAKSDDLQELFSLNPEMNYNNHNVWTEFKGEYYIIASKEETGNEIWKTDGTAAGTRILKDINPGPESGVTSTDFYFHNGLMYFSAKTETHGKELWVTDGTEAGTRMVMDYAPGEVGSNPLGFTVFDNKIFLSLFDTNEVDPWLIRNELVYTEDNFNTFHKLNDTWSDSIYNVSLHPSMARGDHLYFWSGYGAGELYSIEKGNYQVQRVEDLYLYNREPIVFNGETYLQLGGDAGLGVWKINTEGGLYKLCDCTFSSDKVEHIVFNDLLFFNGSPANNSGNSELWVSDGTPEGTREFMDINQVSRYGWMPESDPRNFFKWGDRFVFKAREDEFGWELWISDGTQAGTHILIDHNQGFWHTSGGYELAEYDGDLYLGLDNAIAGNELMKITRCSDFPEPQISIDKPYLKVDPIYDSYLWHECKDYTALPADNQHEIWPHQDQEYRVLVQKDGCWAMSSCAQIEPNSIVESKNSNLELYPNPVLGSVFRVNTDEDFHEYSIFSASGQLMSSGKIEKSSKEALEFDVSHMASGLYLIQLKSENTRESTRFVIP